MLTGRYPHHCVPGYEYPLPPSQPTIAAPFREAAYQTACIGKWRLDGYHEREGRAAMHVVPPDRRGGFDVWIGYENNNSMGLQGPWRLRGLSGYEKDELTNLGIKYLKERAEEAKSGKAPALLCRASR